MPTVRQVPFKGVCWIIALASQCFVFAGKGAPYDLSAVRGMEAFAGSGGGRELLRQNGFVVAAPEFKQIFQAYIDVPALKKSAAEEAEAPSLKQRIAETLPSFITPDSAWDAYHFLLEEGVKEVEEKQAKTLLVFSRRLWTNAVAQSAAPELAWYASIGLALQDGAYRDALGAGEKAWLSELRNGASPVETRIGFPLLPARFQAQGFYTRSSELADYYAARQWYANVVFRLAKVQETRCALALAEIVSEHPELLSLWKRLSEPYDQLLALAEDGDVSSYHRAKADAAGTNASALTLAEAQIATIQQRLDGQLAKPRINDQSLSPGQYNDYGKQTKGFRLLPPRQLPCAIVFQNTVEPKIPGRTQPTALDFLVASPVMRSPAAVRAAKGQCGEVVAGLIAKADCGPMPASLHGEAMRLLAKLQEPLPREVAPAMQTEAWADLQLWSQLGAWAQQRHTWALHAKVNVTFLGANAPATAAVAPYPDFFLGLGALARHTAESFAQFSPEPKFDAKSAAQDIQALLTLAQKIHKATKEEKKELYARWHENSAKFEQLGLFEEKYYLKHRVRLDKAEKRDGYEGVRKEVEQLVARCAKRGAIATADAEILRMYYDCRGGVVGMLGELAEMCDRLAALAAKSIKGEPLTDDEIVWTFQYGPTLARFHLYESNSYEEPKDDFAIVSPVFVSPASGVTLYAGLARPCAVYVIIPNGRTIQLYRGAVLTYREFTRPSGNKLSDAPWREMVRQRKVPAPPKFTRSFLRD